jgi:hypothetical protein
MNKIFPRFLKLDKSKKFLAFVSTTNEIFLYETKNFSLLKKFVCGNFVYDLEFCFMNNEYKIFAVGEEGLIYVFDIILGK